MQCVSCPPDSLCYGSDADANANASCDGASERVIAGYVCRVRSLIDNGGSGAVQASGIIMVLYPVSWISNVACVFYILCPRQKASNGSANWENRFPCRWYGPVRWRLVVLCVLSMLSCQRDAEEMGPGWMS